MKKDMSTEIWKPVLGYEGLYEVSNLGKVRSLNYNKTGKTIIMSGFTTKRGYKRVLLSKAGVHKKYSIHRLVAEAFIPNPRNKPYINHINGNSSENNVNNLEWCTPSENNFHAYREGLSNAKGEKNGKAKLTEQQVKEIRNATGLQRQIAAKFGISQANVSVIKNKVNWGHV